MLSSGSFDYEGRAIHSPLVFQVEGGRATKHYLGLRHLDLTMNLKIQEETLARERGEWRSSFF